MNRNKQFLKSNSASRQRGQGMSEYIIVVALIAIASIGVVSMFGSTIRNQVAAMAKEMSGQSGADSIADAKTKADDAESKAKVKKSLENYGGAN